MFDLDSMKKMPDDFVIILVAFTTILGILGVLGLVLFRGRMSVMISKLMTLICVVSVSVVAAIVVLNTTPYLAPLQVEEGEFRESEEHVDLAAHDKSTSSVSLPIPLNESDQRPSWISESDDHAVLRMNEPICISGDPQLTLEQARRNAWDHVVDAIQSEFVAQHPECRDWKLEREHLHQEDLITRDYNEPYSTQLGNGTTKKMPRVFYEVTFDDEDAARLYTVFQDVQVEQRMNALGAVVAFFIVLCGSAAMYFQFDTRTQGRYRNRLKLASAAVTIAAGVGASAFLNAI